MPSRDTQEKLAQCLKQVVCDVLRCLDDAICPTGDSTRVRRLSSNALGNCLKTAICSFARCVPDALCPPKTGVCVTDVLPCDFAVEEQLLLEENA